MVHNGIIENHAELREDLAAAGQVFETETDTEVVAQLVDLNLQRGMDPIAASRAALDQLRGAYAVAMIFAGHPELIVAAQHGAPLAVGFGEDEMYVASDALALVGLTRRIAYMRDGDWTIVGRKGSRIFDAAGAEVRRPVTAARTSGALVGKGQFRHFMEKELYEHPVVIERTLRTMLDERGERVELPGVPLDLGLPPRVTVSGCGSAYYAGLVGRWWLEQIARVPTDCDVASEFRYRDPPMSNGGLGLLVSQSGETADTLSALRCLRASGQHVLSVINVPESSMARLSDAVLETAAGPEIGVASTKAFTSQLIVLICLAVAMGRARGTVTAEQEATIVRALRSLPEQALEVLEQRPAIAALARRITKARDVLFLGRGNCFPIALEGALKLKEISYIHAEAFAAGEMKHGPIALIDDTVPVLAVVPSGPLFEKTASKSSGSGGAWRPDRRVQRCGRSRETGSDRRGDHRASGGRSDRGTCGLRDRDAVAGLPGGGPEGHRHRSATQPREVRNCRIVAFRSIESEAANK